ncbi:MAG: hypothetical protein ABL993_17230 [Vicinamibacterales bacterium]
MKGTRHWLEWVKRGIAGGAMVAAMVVGARQVAAQAERMAPIDLRGTWVSVVTEDWHLRMITPEKGDYEGLPLNDEAKKIVGAWVPVRGDGDACKAFGAPAIMRVPGRVKISWQSGGDTLRIQTDAGQQTRLLHFAGVPPRGQVGWQGYSAASWVYGRGFNPLVPPAANTRQEDQARAAGGTLKVVTTNLKPGYLRKNGVPFSEQATVTEYFELVTDPQGAPWFVVTTMVSDPKYLLRDYITSSNFKKEPDDAKWRPSACTLQ